MALTIGVPRETFPGERRVALTPRATETLGKLGAGVIIEESAGVDAGFPDQLYVARSARVGTRAEVFAASGHHRAGAFAGSESGGGPRGSAAAARRPNRDWIRRTADGGGRSGGARQGRRFVLRHGADAAHHAGAEHGRAVVHGHYRRISRGVVRGRSVCRRFFRCS